MIVIGPDPSVQHQTEAWMAIDPDPDTRAELARLAVDDPDRLAALFEGRVDFGTAGLRAPMGPGPTRMNRVVVAQTTAGLMRWLPPGARVVIGYDARHHSARFAADTAAVVAGYGGRAEVLPGPLPTPVLALAVLDQQADAGIMITASHNPAADNGYKLYLSDGIQLIGPADQEIAAQIDAVADLGRDELAPGAGPGGGSVVTLGPEPAERHLAAAVAACVTGHREVRIVYTPLHGVAGRSALAAFAAAGFPAPEVVTEQFEPDPDFPTVAYPNPEEAGVLDLAVARAIAADADVVLANDPDGDRLAVAVPDRSGRWIRLTGDQVGVLLADHLIRHSDGHDRLVASSLVSSRLISALARAEGVGEVRTLTGFKWVARPIVDEPGHRYLFGYEEALGYCVGDRVRDKDGISAALVMAEMVAECRAEGRTLWDALDVLAARFGVHLTEPVTVRFDGDVNPTRMQEAVARAVAHPPVALAGVRVAEVDDLAAGGRLPPTPGVVWHLEDGSRVVVRPSGTEPKLKAYLEVIEPVEGNNVDSARARAAERLGQLRHAVADRLGTNPEGRERRQ